MRCWKQNMYLFSLIHPFPFVWQLSGNEKLIFRLQISTLHCRDDRSLIIFYLSLIVEVTWSNLMSRQLQNPPGSRHRGQSSGLIGKSQSAVSPTPAIKGCHGDVCIMRGLNLKPVLKKCSLFRFVPEMSNLSLLALLLRCLSGTIHCLKPGPNLLLFLLFLSAPGGG